MAEVTEQEKFKLMTETLMDMDMKQSSIRDSEAGLDVLVELVRKYLGSNRDNLHGTTTLILTTIPDGKGDADVKTTMAGDPFNTSKMLLGCMCENPVIKASVMMALILGKMIESND